MFIDLYKLRETCWEDFAESLEVLKPNIESIYVALEKEDLVLVSDQLSIVLTKLLEAYTKMRMLSILDAIELELEVEG